MLKIYNNIHLTKGGGYKGDNIIMETVQKNEILTLDFAKEVCNNFNDLCYEYKLNFEEETLMFIEIEENLARDVIALDDMKLLKLRDGAVYIEFDADRYGHNCCEINESGLKFYMKLFLESNKIDLDNEFARVNLKRQETREASFKSAQLTTSSCMPKLKMQSACDLKHYDLPLVYPPKFPEIDWDNIIKPR